MAEKIKGKVKWFSSEKGYGFISDEQSNDYFVHHSEIPKGSTLNDDDAVSFEPVNSVKGMQAIKVETI